MDGLMREDSVKPALYATQNSRNYLFSKIHSLKHVVPPFTRPFTAGMAFNYCCSVRPVTAPPAPLRTEKFGRVYKSNFGKSG